MSSLLKSFVTRVSLKDDLESCGSAGKLPWLTRRTVILSDEDELKPRYIEIPELSSRKLRMSADDKPLEVKPAKVYSSYMIEQKKSPFFEERALSCDIPTVGDLIYDAEPRVISCSLPLIESKPEPILESEVFESEFTSRYRMESSPSFTLCEDSVEANAEDCDDCTEEESLSATEGVSEGSFEYREDEFLTQAREISEAFDDDEDQIECGGLSECRDEAEELEAAEEVEELSAVEEIEEEEPFDEPEADDETGDLFAQREGEAKVFEKIPINENYIIPMDFLQLSDVSDRHSFESEIRRNSELLVRTLNDFGIESKVVAVNRGPVITLYEMEIAPGIRVNKIAGLADDIAMALAASRVRVVAPIPGKKAIGIEVPNLGREMVTLGDVLGSTQYKNCDMVLKVGLGQDILGKPVMLDLKKQPHLLIAGATGAGKSVCVNTLITSLIYNYDPNKVRFIMVDPKMVELQLYNGIPHILTPVITEPDVAPKALKWAIFEMERRYKLLSELCTRDIERYNEKIKAYKGDLDMETLPYIVIIVDELADLMMVAPKEIEGYITRIAQKARAVGIHLVLATQRPSVDVITGIIKANFPARIAFQVAQRTDSRTILDQNGAERLLGKGDMLYQSPTSSFPVRVQGAFISEDEIIKVVRHSKKFGTPRYIDIEDAVDEDDDQASDDEGMDDELFTEALKIVEQTRKASASYLQRRLSIGYNRAARIIERMEEMGYVGPQQGSKPREVYV